MQSADRGGDRSRSLALDVPSGATPSVPLTIFAPVMSLAIPFDRGFREGPTLGSPAAERTIPGARSRVVRAANEVTAPLPL